MTGQSITHDILDLRLRQWDEVTSFNQNSIILIEPSVEFTQEEINLIISLLARLQTSQIHLTYHSLESRNELSNLYRLPLSIDLKFNNLQGKLRSLFIKAFGREPKRIQFTLRTTSNTRGFSISKIDGGDSEGLHDHIESGINHRINFVWALKGKGVRIELQVGDIRDMPEGLLASFGDNVRHASPNSEEMRFIVVGAAEDY